MLRSRRALSGLAIALATACGPLHRGGVTDAVVLFNNQSLNQADVYAVRTGGPEFRIGTVSSNRKDALRLPPTFTGAGEVTIVARTLASNRTPRTGPLTLAAGDTIEVTLPVDERVLTVLPPRTP
jgi:hypothetical protein